MKCVIILSAADTAYRTYTRHIKFAKKCKVLNLQATYSIPRRFSSYFIYLLLKIRPTKPQYGEYVCKFI
ncbi:unnamed protein product, partial [Iphiclides podalirius]